MKEIFAENLPYWETSRTAPDTWLCKARKEIQRIGGKVTGEVFGANPETHYCEFILVFEIGGDRYKIVWPVLKSRRGRERSARIQAATMLYHDVKARCVSAMVLGPRAVFAGFLMLPDGRTLTDAVNNLALQAPRGDVVEGEVSER